MHTFHFDDQYHTYHSAGQAMAPDGRSTVHFSKDARKLPYCQNPSDIATELRHQCHAFELHAQVCANSREREVGF